MSGSWPFVVGAVAACVAGSALGCRDPKESPKPALSTEQESEPSGSAQPKVAISAPAAPSLPSQDAAVEPPTDPAPAAPIDAAPLADFDRETRDPAWAPKVEREIKQRFAKVRGGKLESAECRHSACRLMITGSENDVGQTIADLESARGLHGFAKNVVLSAPEKKPDGSIVLRATAMFER